MNRYRRNAFTSLAVLSALALVFITAAIADTTKIEGIIVGRSGNEVIVQYLQGAELAFLLNDSTKVSQVGGVFKARRTDKSMAALIPGLKVKVEGERNGSGQLIATSVKFSGDDLERAQVAAAANRQQHEEHQAEMERQAAALREQNEQLKQQQAEIASHKAQIDAAVARFGQMDDYYILDELTVYFVNGKTAVDSKYEAPLLELATKAQSINGYVIEVKGYASTAGSTEVNQRLSEDRADNVTNMLLQKGHVPLTRILAPGAMGEAHQVGKDTSAEGQAQNRRVVVRVLQNKAIAGI
jgi:outer membrane protein OmpA-like peptidoglycan-associated protein